MNVLFLLVPLALVLAGLGVWAFVWAVRRGQFDDVHTPAMRMLVDEGDEASPEGATETEDPASASDASAREAG